MVWVESPPRSRYLMKHDPTGRPAPPRLESRAGGSGLRSGLVRQEGQRESLSDSTRIPRRRGFGAVGDAGSRMVAVRHQRAEWRAADFAAFPNRKGLQGSPQNYRGGAVQEVSRPLSA